MNTLETIGRTIAEDFGDIPDAAQATRILLRLLLAALLGGAIGFEREKKGKEAGLRTMMIVSLGAALFVLVIQQGGGTSADISRVIQGTVAGIGFLGIGTILNHGGEGHIKGLTTAASIWLTAAIGVAAGLGREATAMLTTLLALVILGFLPHIEAWAFGPEGRFTSPTTPSDPTTPPGLPAPPPAAGSRG
jgi:putative Mg2+ transporter-C (MgtC) family protein